MTTSRESRERLIDEVKRFPVLYDTRHEQHRDIDVRDRCWSEIATRLGANSEMLKREWKILRDSLRQSLKKSRGGVTTKAGAPCKKWRFQARMSFLLPHMTKRNPRHSLRDDIKLDMETEVSEAGEVEEWSAAARAQPGAGAGAGGDEGELDALELFFASVCASARRLPAHQQRALKRHVLDALQCCEEDAEQRSSSNAHPQPSTTDVLDDFKRDGSIC